MRLLLLMSSLRSGSHMVRSMLRDEPTIRDLGGEHMPLTPADLERLSGRPETTLVPLKYGHLGFTGHCLDLAAAENACALVLHRRDAAAQARSLAHARRYGSWFGPVDGAEPVDVSEAEIAVLRERNERDLARITAALQIPHVVLAYEDLSASSVRTALEGLFGRPIVIREPSTTRSQGRSGCSAVPRELRP